MKRFIIVLVMALSVTMILNVKVMASDSDPTPTVDPSPTPTPLPDRISTLIQYGDNNRQVVIGTVIDYYNNILTYDQRQIVNYLLGMYNYTYISARGFQYNNTDTTMQFVNRLVSFGERFFDIIDSYASRLDSYMQQYISAIISYAGTIDSTFSTWLDYISSGAENEEYLYIPFTKDSLNSWTNYYNDPSVFGVLNWGVYNSDWVSGNFVDFELTGFIFDNSVEQAEYNDFILEQSPVLYSYSYSPYGNPRQIVVSLKDISDNVGIFNSLYIQRNNNGYQYFRFGFNDRVTNTNYSPRNIVLYSDSSRRITVETSLYDNRVVYSGHIVDSGSLRDLSSIVSYAFQVTPFYNSYSYTKAAFYNSYPYIEHVYLVDDLNSLSNKVEIFNTTDLDLQGDNPWINLPKDDYNWQITLDPLPDLPDNLVKDNGDPVSDNDLYPQIVNNTVINNYEIVAPGTVINVPVDWLNGEGNYLDYTNTTAFPFFVMVGDIFEALGEIRIFLIAVLILGLAAGVVVKFLL